MLDTLINFFSSSNIMHLIYHYGYIGMAAITFLESSIFFLLPGDSLLFTAGIVASRGHFNIFILVPVFFFSTLIGSLVGYWLGYHITYLRRFKIFRHLVNHEHLNKVHVFFEKYGKLAMLFNRFVPIARTFGPIAAGAGRMKYTLFIKYNIVGAALWSGTVTLLGYFLGRKFPHIQELLPLMITLIVLVSISPGIFHFSRKSWRKGLKDGWKFWRWKSSALGSDKKD